jgi:heme exporter protein C
MNLVGVTNLARTRAVLGWLALISLGATCGLGLALPHSHEQEEFSRLIAIHPPLAWTMMLSVLVAAVAGVVWFVRRTPVAEKVIASSLEIAAVFTALTLATGSIWGRPTWGVWWQWDPLLTSVALLMAMLLGFIALRQALAGERSRPVVTAIYSIALVPLIGIVHFSVDWWRSLHQGRTITSPDPGSNADPGFIVAMLIGFAAFTILYTWLLMHRVALEQAEEDAEERVLRQAIVDRRAEATASASS